MAAPANPPPDRRSLGQKIRHLARIDLGLPHDPPRQELFAARTKFRRQLRDKGTGGRGENVRIARGDGSGDFETTDDGIAHGEKTLVRTLPGVSTIFRLGAFPTTGARNIPVSQS